MHCVTTNNRLLHKKILAYFKYPLVLISVVKRTLDLLPRTKTENGHSHEYFTF